MLVASPNASAHVPLTQALGNLGYDVLTATSADELFERLQQQKIAGVLVDLDLANEDPVRLIRRLVQITPAPAVLVVSANGDVGIAVRCLQAGALDYLNLSSDRTQLGAAVTRALTQRTARRRREYADRVLREELARLTLRLRKARSQSCRSSLGALEFLVYMMELRDRYLAGHSVRVAQIAASMAAELRRDEAEIEQVRVAGRLHDVGMLCIGEGILSKTGPLTAPEMDRVRQHVVIGDSILAQLSGVEGLRAFVRSHHERWDGRGYPDHLSGPAIPWGAQLIGAAEIYDAFTSSRPYRTAVTPGEAIEQMGRLAGTAVSPEAYESLAIIVEQGRALVFVDAEDESRLGSLESSPALARPQ